MDSQDISLAKRAETYNTILTIKYKDGKEGYEKLLEYNVDEIPVFSQEEEDFL